MNELIPRALLFGNPERTRVQLSHDGRHLSFIAPVNGVQNIWVAPVEKPGAAQPITNDTEYGIRYYDWAFNHSHVLYIQDRAGDENWHVYSVDVSSHACIDLTPIDGVNAQVKGISLHFPDKIMVGLNDRSPHHHDLYKINITTGSRVPYEQNDQGFVDYTLDRQFQARLGTKLKPNGGSVLYRQTHQGWEVWQVIPSADALTTKPLAFDIAGRLYMTDSRDRNTAALYRINLETDERVLISEDARADVGSVLSDPISGEVQAVGFTVEREELKVTDPEIAPDLEYLRSVSEGEFGIQRSLVDRQWLISDAPDDRPTRFYVYDRAARTIKFLFTDRPALEWQPLVEMRPVTISARDGLPLVSYLTQPFGSKRQPVPLVLFVHGGLWERDRWGFNATVQWLANRGYAVLQVNFRGSLGFGKTHLNVGHLKQGAKMHEDLLDAVEWAIKQGITRRETIAIMGGSYGGYAMLAGLTMTPGVFACGVDIVGPCDLRTLFESCPPQTEPSIATSRMHTGTNSTEGGRSLLRERNLMAHAANTSRPLLIVQSTNNPKGKQSESDQKLKTIREQSTPVTYVLFPDEGHSAARPENRLAISAVIEAFLAKYLGGRAEPLGDALERSSLQILKGESESLYVQPFK
jgi:dipeptidyl aminopeptidase/acylaminoacyl peptidase